MRHAESSIMTIPNHISSRRFAALVAVALTSLGAMGLARAVDAKAVRVNANASAISGGLVFSSASIASRLVNDRWHPVRFREVRRNGNGNHVGKGLPSPVLRNYRYMTPMFSK